MKILFCNPLPITKELGGSKVTVELAEAMREIGWDCTLIGSNDIGAESHGKTVGGYRLGYAEALRHYLKCHAEEYDVVDYDHSFLPYPRSEFPAKTLFVARSVLLAHHFDEIKIPNSGGLKSRVRGLIFGSWDRAESKVRTMKAHLTIQQSDLVNVSNEDDRTILVRHGISENKIVVIPYGISASRRPLFDAVSSAVPEKPVVAFVGTFDYRKGAREFPQIVREVAAAAPDVRFRLLGTAGMFQTEAEVLAHFPSALRSRIEVIPRYKPEQLPSLLAPCSVGVFPSYIEGFGFGVLEMLAASVPVIAYNSPGPPMMLTPEYLVPQGDTRAMTAQVITLLKERLGLNVARKWAKDQSYKFCWEQIAQATSKIYGECWQRKRLAEKAAGRSREGITSVMEEK